MIAAVFVSGVFLFTLAFVFTGLPRTIRVVTGTATAAVQKLKDRNLDEEAKERVARESGLALLAQSGLILVKAALTLVFTVLPFWAADRVGIAAWADTTAFALRLDVLAVTTVIMVTGAILWRRLPKGHRSQAR